MGAGVDDPCFEAVGTRRLRQLGLSGGRVLVTLRRGTPHGAALELCAAGAAVRIAVRDVERLRVGYVEGKARYYETRLWRGGDARPLTLYPHASNRAAYARVVRAAVTAIADAGRIDHVESGLSRMSALATPALLAPVALGAAALALFALSGEPWWGRLIVPVIPTAVFALTLWLALTRHWPRPIRRPADLDAQLPP